MEPLSTGQIEKELGQLDGWSFADDKLSRTLKFENFRQAMAFMVRVGFEAEEQVHHPDWANVYNTVTINLNTHDAGGKVTNKDIKLAKAIDKIYKQY
jgi:4a-hydroxytetrahydrobiopterin dehydratase